MRGKIDLVGHQHYHLPDLDPEHLPPIHNVIVKAKSPENEWIEEATRSIGNWRAIFRSTYIRWALAINGLHLASTEYRKINEPQRRFGVSSIRFDHTGKGNIERIAEWDYAFAAQAHLESAPMLCAWGLMDMYAVLEEFVFSIYRIFLNSHPDCLMQGPDFRDLRRLYRQRNESEELMQAWKAAWEERITSWQQKKLYDGLGRVFLALCNTAGINAPSTYKQTTTETWAESISGLSLVRNSLIHGVSTGSEEIEEFCKQPTSLGFSFKAGEPLLIQLLHLQSVECFTDQLLTALNLSLCELAGLPLP